MPVKVRIGAIVLAALSIAGPGLCQDRVADLRSRLTHEPSPVNRAKLMPQLGDAEFAEIDSDVSQDKLPEALMVLETYRDEVQSCDKALDAMGLDAQKHPGGYKQLQFSLRDSLRRLDAEIVNMTSEDQAPFVAIRQELGDLNRHLIEHLFGRAPAGKPGHADAPQ
ncbi:MAG: hypothetical protein WCC21_03545 [Candidatus Acidiferrales bacterium]